MNATAATPHAYWQKSPHFAAGLLSGWPLDAVKIMAAVLMLADHANDLLFGNQYVFAYLAGRGAFPLFCWAAAAALLRARGDRAVWRQAAFLLAFAFLSELASQWARPHYDVVNVLFTLALGVALSPVVLRMPVWGRGCSYALAAGLMAFPSAAEFGAAGALLPVALAGALMGGRLDMLAAAVLAAVMNFSPFLSRDIPLAGGASVVAAATLWPLAILWFVARQRLPQTGRLLPRYALHAFYPLHMVMLAALARLLR